MKRSALMNKATVLMASACMSAALAVPAHAMTVNYTVAGVGPTSYPAATTPPANAPWGVNGYPGDTVELQTYTGSLDLTPGTTVQQINTMLWMIDYTYGGTATDPNEWSDLAFTVNADRNITIGGVTGTLHQSGNLDVTWENDYLSFDAGTMLTLTVLGFNIEITALSLPSVGGNNFDGDNPWTQAARTMYAQFDISEAPLPAVPLPAALPLLACGIGGLGVAGWLGRRKRQPAKL